jgi:hypothetical protein
MVSHCDNPKACRFVSLAERSAVFALGEASAYSKCFSNGQQHSSADWIEGLRARRRVEVSHQALAPPPAFSPVTKNWDAHFP